MRRFLMFALVLVLAACGSPDKTDWRPGANPPAAAAVVSFPAADATDVQTAMALLYTAPGDTNVTLTDAAGGTVDGSPLPDKSGWLPGKQLAYATSYTAKITAGSATTSVSFKTMAKPASLSRVSSQVGDNMVVGVGMPMILSFGVDIPKDKRADVQRRLFMSSDPPQEGSWHWFSAKEVHFRPKDYWQPGTRLTLRAAVGGLPLTGKPGGTGGTGGPVGSFGERDLTVDATVGKKVIMEVDNATKQMTVTEDGVLLKTMPVSLGKPSNPSDSGNFVIMDKNETEWFDSSTYGVPVDSPDGYRTKVQFPQRITMSGQYIHAAPWSVNDQGRRNVSHGCVNVSLDLARWLYSVTHLGDPVIVKNTESRVKYGDGWTDWELPFDEYRKGSAL